jgi:hypothetical protein
MEPPHEALLLLIPQYFSVFSMPSSALLVGGSPKVNGETLFRPLVKLVDCLLLISSTLAFSFSFR